MKIRKYWLIIVVLVLLIGPHRLFSAEAEDMKAAYKISDSEIAEFLNKAKADNPAVYQSYMQIKKTNPAQFEQAVCGAVVGGRIKRDAGTSAQLQKAQANEMKVRFNISDTEIATFLNKLSNADPGAYKSLMRLKGEGTSMYEQNLLGRIVQYRKSGSFTLPDSEAGNEPQFAALQQVGVSIQNARQQWLNAKNDADKQRLRSNLRALLVKGYDLSTQLITAQAAKAEEQVRAIKKMVGDRVKDRESSIDASLTQMTE